jgi:hypothetical protein
MLTEATTPVDAAPRSVMWTVSAVAERDSVSKQAVSKKVRELAGCHGLSVEKNARGYIVRLNVAEYDHLRGRFGDPSKAQAPRLPLASGEVAPVQPNESYDEALRQKTWIGAERDRLKLAEDMGRLVSVDGVASALGLCGEEIARSIDRFIGSVDEMAAAVAKDGVHGLRVVVKQLTFRMKGEVANALEAVASNAPATEEQQPLEKVDPQS